MKVCIFGAGAVGGHVATRLAAAGHAEVSVVARGAHLEAIRARGLELRNNVGDVWRANVAQATDRPETLPPQDLVLVALKACALAEHAKTLDRLLATGGAVAFLNNGIPWWWNAAQPDGGSHLPLLDPDGLLWSEVRPERTLGAVVVSPNEIESPGVVRHRDKARNRFVFGMPKPGDAGLAANLARIIELFKQSGLPAEAATDLRLEIWRKLLLNAGGNTVSALTRLGTMERGRNPELQALSLAVASEIAAIAKAMGWPLPEGAIAEAVAVGQAQNLRPSMLQDVLGGRPMEVEALLGQPQRFAREFGISTPVVDVLVPLLRGLDESISASLKKANS